MEKPSPLLVGREFVRQYYTLLNKAPDYLHRCVHALKNLNILVSGLLFWEIEWNRYGLYRLVSLEQYMYYNL